MNSIMRSLAIGIFCFSATVSALERASPESLDLSTSQLKVIRTELARRSDVKETLCVNINLSQLNLS